MSEQDNSAQDLNTGPATIDSANNLNKEKNQAELSTIKDSKKESYTAIISNTCLLGWAILLAVIGMQAVSGNASTVILETANNPIPSKSKTFSKPSTTELNALDELSKYIDKHYSEKDKVPSPPIAIVLDRLQIGVPWRVPTEVEKAQVDSSTKLTPEEYQSLFDIVAKRLEAISDFSPEGSAGSNLKIKNDFMPSNFRAPTFKEQEIPLPVEAVLWMKARQAANAAKKSQISFLDLFILLVILGGFGSWIYLVRRHIDPKITPKLDEYFYRPVLGMALAIAVFIVNITLHSFVSTANINDVRRETLILLAFTAGLLSDKTYEFVEKVTGEKLGDRKPEDARKIESK